MSGKVVSIERDRFSPPLAMERIAACADDFETVIVGTETVDDGEQQRIDDLSTAESTLDEASEQPDTDSRYLNFAHRERILGNSL